MLFRRKRLEHVGLGELFVFRRRSKLRGWITKVKDGEFDEMFRAKANLDTQTLSVRDDNNNITRNAVLEVARIMTRYTWTSNLLKCRRRLNFDGLPGNSNDEIPSNQLEFLVPLECAMLPSYIGLCGNTRLVQATCTVDLSWITNENTDIWIGATYKISLSKIEPLPDYILLKLLTDYISMRDALNVCQTSQRLLMLRRSTRFWSRRLLRDLRCTFTFRTGSERSYEMLEDTYKCLLEFGV